MKNIHYYVIILSLISFSCKKDSGHYKIDYVDSKFNGTIYEYLESKPGVFDSLLTIINRVKLDSILKDSANVTFFAPTNESFKVALQNLNTIRKMTDKKYEYYSNVEYTHLDTLISYYLIRGALTTDSLKIKEGLRIYDYKFNHAMHAKIFASNSSGYVEGGPRVIELSDTKNSQFTRNWVSSMTASVNIEANNGVVHVLSPEHIFGFGDFVSRMTYIAPPPNLFSIYTFIDSVSRPGNSAVEAGKYVFDGNPETKYYLGNLSSSIWMQAEFETPVLSNAYTLTSANDLPHRDPTDWMLQGSQDGESWITLDSRVSEIFDNRFDLRVFRIKNTTAYKFYRLTILRTQGGTQFQLADWSVNYEEEKPIDLK